MADTRDTGQPAVAGGLTKPAGAGSGRHGRPAGTRHPAMSPVRALALVLLTSPMLILWPAAGQGAESVAGERLALTLDDAIRLALQNNRGLLDARLQRTIQEFSLEVTEDRYRPTASVGSSLRGQKEQDDWTTDVVAETGLRVRTGGQVSLRWSKPLAGRDDTAGTVTLGFSQPLLRGFGADVETASLRAARLGGKIGVLAFRETIAGVVDSTIRAWRGLVRAERQLEIGEASLERARQQLATNRTLIEAGQMAEREILQSEADVAERELGLIETRNGVTTANFGLIDILDIDSATAIEPVQRPAAARPVFSVQEAIEVALSRSPDRARALMDKEIAEIDLEVAEDDQRWDLSLDAEASRGTGGGGQGTDYSAGLRLTVPLWDRGPELGLMGARADVTQAERRLVELRQSMDIAVRQAVHDVEVGLRRIELARQALALTEEKLAIERSKLQQGLSSTFQLSRFEEDLVSAQNAEVDALVDYENALTSLDRTLGTTLETWGIAVEQVGR